MINIWKLTNFWTDNYAENYFEIKSIEDIEKLKNWNLKKLITIGWWSNILLSQEEYFEEFFISNKYCWVENLWMWFFRVNSWENITRFILYLNKEFQINLLNPLFWLPWTVWWAVVWNAWCFWVEIWKYVKSIEYVDVNWNFLETTDYIPEYRGSNIKNSSIFLMSVILDLSLINGETIKTWQEYFNRRKEKQEHFKTCWSFFKNNYIRKWNSDILDKLIEHDDWYIKWLLESSKNDEIVVASWWLNEKCWLKWYEHNWVIISNKHANFFVNLENKDSKNILKLSEIVKNKVYDKFRIELHEEVNIL